MSVWAWVEEHGVDLLSSIALPILAILVPTLIAIKLARDERRAAAQERNNSIEAAARERRLQAGADVLVSLAHLVSIDAMNTPMQERLGELRGRIAVYRAWSNTDDISGDWLALKHTEGMHAWGRAFESIEELGGEGPDTTDEVQTILDGPRRWAQTTIETFSQWLSGHLDDEKLRAEGAQLLARFPPDEVG